MKKIYISGKITGDANYMAKFAKAEKYLKKQGYIVYNPAKEWEDEDYSYDKILSFCIDILRKCDAIYLLSNWQDSNGAKAEKAFAEAIGLEVMYQIEPKEELTEFELNIEELVNIFDFMTAETTEKEELAKKRERLLNMNNKHKVIIEEVPTKPKRWYDDFQPITNQGEYGIFDDVLVEYEKGCIKYNQNNFNSPYEAVKVLECEKNELQDELNSFYACVAGLNVGLKYKDNAKISLSLDTAKKVLEKAKKELVQCQAMVYKFGLGFEG